MLSQDLWSCKNSFLILGEKYTLLIYTSLKKYINITFNMITSPYITFNMSHITIKIPFSFPLYDPRSKLISNYRLTSLKIMPYFWLFFLFNFFGMDFFSI